MQAMNTCNELQELDSGNRHLSSLELACGVEVRELSLRDMSNSQLQELVRMARGWRPSDRVQAFS